MKKLTWMLGIVLATASSLHADETTVLEMGSEWKYYDQSESPGDNWHAVDFDDSEWKSGAAPLGYGDDDIKQKISFGEDESKKNLCAYFRTTIEVADPAAVKSFVGKLVCDDGCAVYVNGEEVYRYNLPDGDLKQDTQTKFIVGGQLERHGMTILIDADKFKAGKNVIAVRVHQQAPDSSDLAINLSLEAASDDAEVSEATAVFEQEQELLKQFEAQQQ